jgi:hypothetical protein
MDAEDWLKGVEKKLVIAQYTDHENVLLLRTNSMGQQPTGGRRTAIPMWTSTPSYGMSSRLVSALTMCLVAPWSLRGRNSPTWNRAIWPWMSTLTHSFSYQDMPPDDINTDEKKYDIFLNGLNDDIQFQLLNTDFQHMVDKAIVIKNKIKEMEKDGKMKVSFSGQSSGSNVRPRFS